MIDDDRRMRRGSLVLPLVALVALACGSRAQTRSVPPTAGDEAPPPSHAEASTPASPATSAILDAHNARRAAHCAPPLAWSDVLARQAQSWAEHLAQNGCGLEHSQSAYGENLAAGTSGMLSPADVVDLWYAEREHYAFRTGGFSMHTGHFTQLVWVGSTSVGCAMATCNGLDVWVCNYDPPGNVEGQYRENVLPTSCH